MALGFEMLLSLPPPGLSGHRGGAGQGVGGAGRPAAAIKEKPQSQTLRLW